jgi:hypothetical protein
MATFTYTPDFGATYQVKPNVRVSKFGDGYEQRAQNGLNARAKKWTLKFSLRSDTEINAIVSFLETAGSVSSFDWTDIDGYAGKYVCREWQKSKDRANLNTLDCSFEQVFEP